MMRIVDVFVFVTRSLIELGLEDFVEPLLEPFEVVPSVVLEVSQQKCRCYGGNHCALRVLEILDDLIDLFPLNAERRLCESQELGILVVGR